MKKRKVLHCSSCNKEINGNDLASNSKTARKIMKCPECANQ
ncbi:MULTISPECIES: hypothetical protein [Spiroplasma]|uniref:Uncharacterized protein n=1 Tax=Spiroplasma ixodetis TaxID=2141 RepID=A0ABN6T084_9MOLU|nr:MULTISPECIES: hypothetical protein [Spiroplasma]WDA54132.1 MAG: hypothetical protein PPFGHCPK_00562 [Spiroplasma endosymbiont of Drosophila atripex]WJG69947.1 hypothetical protein SIXOD_v1c09410 [Spiroplasma ixodetis Y32]BDT04568.1 hypothetical protein SHM_22140 [Spiroplasma ixodetis]